MDSIYPVSPRTPAASLRRMFNADEAAAYLAMGRRAFDYVVELGQVRGVRPHGRSGEASRTRLFPIEELDAYVDRLKQEQWKES